MTKGRFSRASRIAAAILAVIWLMLGAAGVILGILRGNWILALVGGLAFWYGLIWERAAAEGRRLPWPAGLFPWRRE